jgi:hypothetical protein
MAKMVSRKRRPHGSPGRAPGRLRCAGLRTPTVAPTRAAMASKKRALGSLSRPMAY